MPLASALLLLLLTGSAWADSGLALVETGYQYMKANQFEKAADKFTEALADFEPYPTGLAYLFRGCCYYKMDSMARATDDVDQTLEVINRQAGMYGEEIVLSAYLLKVSTLLAKGNYKDAKQAISAVIMLPGAGAVYVPYYLGWVDKVLLAATSGQPTTLDSLYRDLQKSTFDLVNYLLLVKGWARG
jgi:tetratricopeptide (TPR) repeat protein